MTNTFSVRPADPAELAGVLAYALRYDGKRRVHHADSAMARITAERLMRHLARTGFVLVRSEPGAPTTAIMPSREVGCTPA